MVTTMASAKLVKVHSQHHHHHHISPSKHHNLSSRKRSLSPVERSCPSNPVYLRNQQSPAMTLDYSLPRSRDLETGSPPRHGVEDDAQSHFDRDLVHSGFHNNPTGRDCSAEADDGDSGRDDLCSSPPPSQFGEDRDPYEAETPTKKNKRKLSSPRRRADISDDETTVKQAKKKKKIPMIPPASPMGEDEDSGIDSYKSIDDTILDVVGGAGGPTQADSPSLERINPRVNEKFDPGSDKRNAALSNSSSVVPLSSLRSSPSSSAPSSLGQNAAGSFLSSKSKHRKKSSSQSAKNRSPSASSNRPKGANLDSQLDMDNNKNSSPPPHDTSIHPGLPPGFLHPMLATAGVPTAAALGFVPSLYFGAAQFGHPALHPSLSVLPPHLQQAYIAAAAAAAQASALAPPTVTSSPSLSQSSSSALTSSAQAIITPSPLPASLYPGAANRAETTLSESQRKHEPSANAVLNVPAKSSAQSSKLQRHQRQSTSSASSSSSPQPQLSKSSPTPSKPLLSSFPQNLLHPSSSGSNSDFPSTSQSSERYCAPSTSASAADPNDSSSSRPQSPEDLSMPGGSGGSRMSRKHRKNYKNMTRERRVEANARERTRVHTISAAFDALRRAVPSYSHNQKLSKLAILRIACSYIMSLARLGDMDYTSASEHIGQPLSFAECVEMTTNTIQTEGRARRRH